LTIPSLFTHVGTEFSAPVTTIHRIKGKIMIFRRNIGSKERVARVVGGILMILCGVLGLHATPLGLVVAAVGGVSIVTGAVRFCPACAMAGRKPIDG